MPSASSRAPDRLERSRRTLRDGGVHAALRHPRTAMAIRASVAASAAWLLAQRIPGGTDFAFYAPFGAVVTTYPAVVRSTTETVRAVTAIMLGGAVGLAAAQLVPWSLAAVATAAGLGVLVGGLPVLGADRSYVPVAAIFVLLVGDGREVGYALSYAGLFLLGALVTILLNAAFPTLPVTRADQAVQGGRRPRAGPGPARW